MDRAVSWRNEFSLKTRDLANIAIFIALIAICSWIQIPAVVPFTLQVMAIFLACYVLGPVKSFVAVVCFLLMGLIGIPVFSGFAAGVSAFMGASGGFLIGFVIFPLLYLPFYLFNLRNAVVYFSVMVVSLLLCYLVGALWFMFIYKAGAIGFYASLTYTVIPFIVPDLIKLLLAYMIGVRIKKYVS